MTNVNTVLCIAPLLFTSLIAQEIEDGSGDLTEEWCIDTVPDCTRWPTSYCEPESQFYDYMLDNCKRTCDVCKSSTVTSTATSTQTTFLDQIDCEQCPCLVKIPFEQTQEEEKTYCLNFMPGSQDCPQSRRIFRCDEIFTTATTSITSTETSTLTSTATSTQTISLDEFYTSPTTTSYTSFTVTTTATETQTTTLTSTATSTITTADFFKCGEGERFVARTASGRGKHCSPCCGEGEGDAPLCIGLNCLNFVSTNTGLVPVSFACPRKCTCGSVAALGAGTYQSLSSHRSRECIAHVVTSCGFNEYLANKGSMTQPQECLPCPENTTIPYVSHSLASCEDTTTITSTTSTSSSSSTSFSESSATQSSTTMTSSSSQSSQTRTYLMCDECINPRGGPCIHPDTKYCTPYLDRDLETCAPFFLNNCDFPTTQTSSTTNTVTTKSHTPTSVTSSTDSSSSTTPSTRSSTTTSSSSTSITVSSKTTTSITETSSTVYSTTTTTRTTVTSTSSTKLTVTTITASTLSITSQTTLSITTTSVTRTTRTTTTTATTTETTTPTTTLTTTPALTLTSTATSSPTTTASTTPTSTHTSTATSTATTGCSRKVDFLPAKCLDRIVVDATNQILVQRKLAAMLTSMLKPSFPDTLDLEDVFKVVVPEINSNGCYTINVQVLAPLDGLCSLVTNILDALELLYWTLANTNQSFVMKGDILSLENMLDTSGDETAIPTTISGKVRFNIITQFIICIDATSSEVSLFGSEDDDVTLSSEMLMILIFVAFFVCLCLFVTIRLRYNKHKKAVNIANKNKALKEVQDRATAATLALQRQQAEAAAAASAVVSIEPALDKATHHVPSGSLEQWISFKQGASGGLSRPSYQAWGLDVPVVKLSNDEDDQNHVANINDFSPNKNSTSYHESSF
eukprot:m.112582 g.112582  ORF g.112582 m.112582 type:complete len:913 (-) comp14093_c0_seq4:42-2780(-)